MVGSNKLFGIIMISVTLLLIIISFLPTVPFSSYSESTGNTHIDFPFYGDGRGTVDGTYYKSTSEVMQNANPNRTWSVYLSWIFQLFAWIVYSFYQKNKDGEANQLQSIFSIRNILLTNLITISGLIYWGIRLNDGVNQRDIEWGYLAVFWVVLISTIINSIVWVGSQKTISSIKSSEVSETSEVTKDVKKVEPSKEPKISRKERKEIEKKTKEEAKILAAKETENSIKHELERQMRVRIEKFRKIVMRSAKLRIEQLASMLRMEQTDLLDWLYDLPEEFGFVINQDIIEFDTVKIGDNIDKLLAGFESDENNKDGKL
ncbi:MAG: hypothetical protein GPJ54_22650 [Candidatus Heimdallarchaeota archaeon]|nr:hypothetical protein [Candidatus Heimdallarchaeota archaeon]